MKIPFIDLAAQYRGIKKEMDAALSGIISRAEFIGGPHPVKFVDVDPVTYTMAPELLKAAITDRTFAVIPVHLHGQMADMTAISALCKSRRVRIIEDAAQAHLAGHNGRPGGSF